MADKLDPNYFYYGLRPYLDGYKEVIYEGVEDGMDKRITTLGGTAGYDPSYQIFERAFGITFTGDLEDVQTKLRVGMPARTRDLITEM